MFSSKCYETFFADYRYSLSIRKKQILYKLFSECPLGYTGIDCAYTCFYPDYGKDCFMKCECTAEMCDFRSGCKHVSTTGKSLK